MDTLNYKIVTPFFDRIIELARTFFPTNGQLPDCFVTTHLLTDRPYFLGALSKVAKICSLTPKPRSMVPHVTDWISEIYKVHRLSRSDLANFDRVQELLTLTSDKQLILIDIGGYYCDSIPHIRRADKNKLIGVVEDTENGHQKYQEFIALNEKIKLPVFSVARSSLKNAEDFLVGQSIVFSTEALLREQGNILQGRRALVLGYGKIGRSIATTLRSRSVEVVIYDRDSTTTVEAFSHGFNIASNKDQALSRAGIVFCATGNRVLQIDHGNVTVAVDDYQKLPDGCYIATATSSDDELETQGLAANYSRRRVTDQITRYQGARKSFYMLNHGQAVNFAHGAGVGPFIYLVHAEIIFTVQRLASILSEKSKIPPTAIKGIAENLPEERNAIAKIWLEHFGGWAGGIPPANEEVDGAMEK